MNTVWQNLRYGARMLIKNPGFSLVVVFTLALGIGANTAIFSVVNAVLLRPLPYDRPKQLIAAFDSLPTVGFPRAGLTEQEYIRLREESRSFEQVALAISLSFTLTGAGEPERVSSVLVSSNFFDALRVKTVFGRGFAPEEELAGKNDVVLLSHNFWQERFNSNPSAIGQTLTLNGSSYTVIGVLPRDFKSPLEMQSATRLELWVPYGFTMSQLNRGSHPLYVMARMREGVSLRQAQAETNTIVSGIVKDYASFYPAGEGNFSMQLESLHANLVGDVRRALTLLLCAVIAVLLIACANIANLLLVRGETRQKEIAVRTALGAGRWQVIKQLLIESVMLSMTGGLAGLLLARWGLDAIIAANPGDVPRLDEISLDHRVLLFTFGIALLTGILFGLAPALHAIKFDLHSALKEGGRAATAQRHSFFRQALVVLETAVALVLLVGAGLLVRSFWQLQRVDTGFNAERLLTMRLSPPASAYQNAQQIAGLYERLIEKLQTLPAVEAVAVASSIPISGSNGDTMMQIEGRPFDLAGSTASTDFRRVSPGYFRALGLRLAQGRLLEASDEESAPLVVVVNEKLARNQWPNENPIGKRFRLLDAPPDQAKSSYLTVAGVVADAKNRALNADVRQEAYLPIRQQAAALGSIGPARAMNLAIRTTTEPASLTNTIRQAVWAIDRNIPITQIITMEQMKAAAVVQPRFNMILLAVFAVVALCLGGIGLYGVIAYTVTQRTHEIGVRMALGAQRRNIVKMVLGRGMFLAAIGVGIGSVTALLLTRLISSLLFGVSPTDPLTFAGVAIMLSAVAFLACWIPARRAMKVDPMVALRYE